MFGSRFLSAVQVRCAAFGANVWRFFGLGRKITRHAQEHTITHQRPINVVQPTLQQPRARGSVALAVGQRSGRSVIADLRQEGSLKCLFPRPYGRTLDAVLVNTAGGITGGDVFGVAGVAGVLLEVAVTEIFLVHRRHAARCEGEGLDAGGAAAQAFVEVDAHKNGVGIFVGEGGAVFERDENIA